MACFKHLRCEPTALHEHRNEVNAFLRFRCLVWEEKLKINFEALNIYTRSVSISSELLKTFLQILTKICFIEDL